MPTIDAEVLARARLAAETIAPLSQTIEDERRLPPEAVRALVEAGVFKLMVPKELGGAQTTAGTLLSVIEDISRADGSAGWCAMIGASSGLMSAFLDEAVAAEVYGPADAISCGVFAPMGRATKVDGGYRVSGRWPFASGCEHSSWRMGGVFVEGPEGQPPTVRSVLFSAEQTRVVDTWNVSGLRGTGSHDLEVSDVLVPDARSFSLSSPARHEGGVYRLPFFGVLASGVAAVTLGIARAAIDSIIALAKKKTPFGSKRGIAHRELVQLHVAQAEAKLRSARAFLYLSVRDAENEVEAHGKASLRGRALLRLAASHAATESAAAVDLAYEAGGATSIYAKHPLQRHFRDVHVATQHIMVSSTSKVLAGRILLDVESDVSTL
jgi:alkylation response protein AidB-like acyl-CoA dehydrogenase